MSLLLTICALHFVAQLSPGPDILLIAKSAASSTRRHSLNVIFGISVGILIWVLLTLSGFTVLIEKFPWIQQVLMLIGGLFLMKMGWAMLQGGLAALKPASNADPLEGSTQLAASPTQNYFLLGLLTNLSNPKTLIYFSSVFSLALSSSANAHLKTQLAIIIPIQTFLTFTALMLLLSLPKVKVVYQRSGSYIDLISGLLFILFAIWLWIDAVFIL